MAILQQSIKPLTKPMTGNSLGGGMPLPKPGGMGQIKQGPMGVTRAGPMGAPGFKPTGTPTQQQLQRQQTGAGGIFGMREPPEVRGNIPVGGMKTPMGTGGPMGAPPVRNVQGGMAGPMATGILGSLIGGGGGGQDPRSAFANQLAMRQFGKPAAGGPAIGPQGQDLRAMDNFQAQVNAMNRARQMGGGGMMGVNPQQANMQAQQLGQLAGGGFGMVRPFLG